MIVCIIHVDHVGVCSISDNAHFNRSSFQQDDDISMETKSPSPRGAKRHTHSGGTFPYKFQ